MSLNFRRYLFIIFVIIFVIMAIIIIPYSFGYSLDPAGFKLQKTGMFVVATDPSGATIYLNDKKQTGGWSLLTSGDKKIVKTPAKLSHIAPGNYRVRLELDGYWPWEKELTINPSQTTYIEDIKFFKRGLPGLMFAIDPKQVTGKISPDKNYLAMSIGGIIKLYDFKTQSTKVLATAETKTLVWSDDSQWLLTDKSALRIDGSINQAVVGPIWPSTVNNQICLQNKTAVRQLDLISGQTKNLLTKNSHDVIKSCLIKNNYSYIIRQTKTDSQLVIVKSGQTESAVIALPRQADYQFINLGNNRLNIFDPIGHKLILIDVNLPWSNHYTLKSIDNPVNVAYWIDSNRLLYGNDFEIWLYDADLDKNTLLTRVSEPINNVFWHPSKNYILYATNGGIFSLELDDRERHNITQLLAMPIIGQAVMDEAGKNIYFFGNIGRQAGYWGLEL